MESLDDEKFQEYYDSAKKRIEKQGAQDKKKYQSKVVNFDFEKTSERKSEKSVRVEKYQNYFESQSISDLLANFALNIDFLNEQQFNIDDKINEICSTSD